MYHSNSSTDKNTFQKEYTIMKKTITIFLSLLMIFTMSSVNVFAANNDAINWNSLSSQTGISVEDLQYAYSTMPENEFYAIAEEYKSAMEYYASLPSSPSLYSSNEMTDVQWTNFKSKLSNGSILITSDSVTLTYAHGHAAIISGFVTTGSGSVSYYFTEHPGGKDEGDLSWRRNIDNTTYWRERSTLGIYNAYSNSTMQDAAVEACSNVVLGKPYNAFANKSLTTYYNCATLVYRCYINSGLDISKTNSSTVLPVDITNSSNLYSKFQHNTFDWGFQ